MTLEDRANLAGQLTSHASFYLLGATVTEDRAEKRRLIARAFRSWSLAARHMSLLERLAPNCAKDGYDEAAKVQEIVERRAG
jgi:hypothetical protein